MQKDYYKILCLRPLSPIKEVKEQFRRLIKKIHPDTSPSGIGKSLPDKPVYSHRKLHDVLEAYEILSNQERKSIYDREYHKLASVSSNFIQHKYKAKTGLTNFDYQKFLLARLHIPHYQMRFIFIHLMHHRDKEALNAVERYHMQVSRFLWESSAHEEAVDCLYLLAEAYEHRRQWKMALEIYTLLKDYHDKKPRLQHVYTHLFQDIEYKIHRLQFF